MSIAELAADAIKKIHAEAEMKHYGNFADDWAHFPEQGITVERMQEIIRDAINEALELAAQEAENLRCSHAIAAHEAAAMAAKDEIAKRIRALMSPQEKSSA